MRHMAHSLRQTMPLKRDSHRRPTKLRAGKIDWISVEATCLLGFCLLVSVVMLISVGDPVAASRRSTDPAIGVREIVSFSTNRPEVAIRYSDRCLIWNPHTDRARSIWLPASEHRITALAGSPVEPRILIGRADGWLTLIDLPSQTPLWEGIASEGTPTHAIFSPDGATTAIATNTGQLVLLDTKTGNPRWKFSSGDTPLMTACFSAEGDRIFTVSAGSKLIAVDARTGQLADVLVDCLVRPSTLDVSRDGRYLAVGTFDGQILLWDLIAKQESYRAEHSSTAILAIHLDPRGEELIYSTTSGTVGAVTLDDGHQRTWIGEHHESVPSIVIQEDGLVSGSFDGEIRTWSRSTAGTFTNGTPFASSETLAPQAL